VALFFIKFNNPARPQGGKSATKHATRIRKKHYRAKRVERIARNWLANNTIA
jgi:hypothetical protein